MLDISMNKISTKVLIGFLAVGFLPMFIIASIALISAESSLQEKTYQKLSTVRDIKKDAIESYFDQVEKQVTTVAETQIVIEALEGFTRHFYADSEQNNGENNSLSVKRPSATEKSQAVRNFWEAKFAAQFMKTAGKPFDMKMFALSDQAIQLQYDYISQNPNGIGKKNALISVSSPSNNGYNMYHQAIHGWLNQYLNRFGFSDIFLIDNEGTVVYSVAKEIDFATSLTKGPWKQTGLAEAYKETKNLKHGQVYFTDFSLYTPSYNKPSGFISTPVYKAFTKGKEVRLGTLVFQMPSDEISNIMNSEAGIGKLGESYLVGSDKLMRSDSALNPHSHSLINSFKYPKSGSMRTLSVEKALNNETGEHVIDKFGNEVLSAYTPIKMGKHHWGLITEMDTGEAFQSIVQLKIIIVVVTFCIVLLIMGMAFVFARKITTPILQLVQKMQSIQTNFNFSERMKVTTTDEIGQAAAAFNLMLESTQKALQEVNDIMANISNGQFDSRVTAELSGDLQELKDNVNGSANSVQTTMESLSFIMNAISNGDFKARLDDTIKGELRDQVNGAMESMQTAIAELKAVMKRLSQGDMDARVNANLKGDLLDLKNNTNLSMDQIKEAIEAISSALKAQSQGDLTVSVTNEMLGELDMLKKSINNSNSALNSVINTVIESAGNVDQASHQVSSGSSDLNNRTQKQAQALEKTATAMEELTATIKQNTDSAISADELAKDARTQAQSGRTIMDETEAAILQIHASSKQIEEITTLIDGIAFQTNLLALNAAVEAARAGEHGRGFAVVAGEVRSLAGKSADAAKEIKQLIVTTVNNIENGTQKIEQTSESLTQINQSIDKVSTIVSEISSASKAQQAGIDQINHSILDIDQTTQQNAALAEQTTSASNSMTRASERLKTAISTFKTKS